MRDEKTQNLITWGTSLVLAAALFLIPLTSSAASISDLQAQQRAKEAQAAAAAAAAAKKQAEANAINTQISNLTQQINATQRAIDDTENQIGATQAAINDLTAKIKQANEQLDAEKIKLNDVLVSWYMEASDSSLTYALLASNTLSDVITNQEYYESIKQQIADETAKIQAMKEELAKSKSEQDQKMASLNDLRAQKQNYFNTTLAQKSYQNQLLNGTLAQKQAYVNQASALQAEIHNISESIYALRQQLGSNEIINSEGCGGYPYCGSTPDIPDPWMFLTRECTSYAAWYFNVIEGKSWRNTRPGSGSAWNWPALASDQGYSVSSSPRVGAIISWGQSASMPYGHVAIVRAVNGDGTIDVSEYNWVKFSYSYRGHVSPARYGSYRYIY